MRSIPVTLAALLVVGSFPPSAVASTRKRANATAAGQRSSGLTALGRAAVTVALMRGSDAEGARHRNIRRSSYGSYRAPAGANASNHTTGGLNMSALPSFEYHRNVPCHNSAGSTPLFFAKRNATVEQCRDACVGLRKGAWIPGTNWADGDVRGWMGCFGFSHCEGPNCNATGYSMGYDDDDAVQAASNYDPKTCAYNNPGQCLVYSYAAYPPYFDKYPPYNGSDAPPELFDMYGYALAEPTVGDGDGGEKWHTVGPGGYAVRSNPRSVSRGCFPPASGPCNATVSKESEGRQPGDWGLWMDTDRPAFWPTQGVPLEPSTLLPPVFSERMGLGRPTAGKICAADWAGYTAYFADDPQTCFNMCGRNVACACASWQTRLKLNDGSWIPRADGGFAGSPTTPKNWARCLFAYQPTPFADSWSDTTELISVVKPDALIPTPAPTPAGGQGSGAGGNSNTTTVIAAASSASAAALLAAGCFWRKRKDHARKLRAHGARYRQGIAAHLQEGLLLRAPTATQDLVRLVDGQSLVESADFRYAVKTAGKDALGKGSFGTVFPACRVRRGREGTEDGADARAGDGAWTIALKQSHPDRGGSGAKELGNLNAIGAKVHAHALTRARAGNRDFGSGRSGERELEHFPLILRFFEGFTYDSTQWLAFERAAGDLDALLGHCGLDGTREGAPHFDGRLDRQFACVVQIVAGLHFVHHTLGDMHRDLKPANILVCQGPGSSSGPALAREETPSEPTLTFKLGDFGLAKTGLGAGTEGLGSQTHTLKGTELYMAPEVRFPEVLKEAASGKVGARFGKRADWWSVGCIVHDIAAGSRYAEGFPAGAPPPSFDPAVVEVCADPAQRYAVFGKKTRGASGATGDSNLERKAGVRKLNSGANGSENLERRLALQKLNSGANGSENLERRLALQKLNSGANGSENLERRLAQRKLNSGGNGSENFEGKAGPDAAETHGPEQGSRAAVDGSSTLEQNQRGVDEGSPEGGIAGDREGPPAHANTAARTTLAARRRALSDAQAAAEAAWDPVSATFLATGRPGARGFAREEGGFRALTRLLVDVAEKIDSRNAGGVAARKNSAEKKSNAVLARLCSPAVLRAVARDCGELRGLLEGHEIGDRKDQELAQQSEAISEAQDRIARQERVIAGQSELNRDQQEVIAHNRMVIDGQNQLLVAGAQYIEKQNAERQGAGAVVGQQAMETSASSAAAAEARRVEAGAF